MISAQTLARPNRYPAACIRCHQQVPAGQGLLVRDDDGRWAADHPGDCPPRPQVLAVPAPVKRVTQDGIYQRPDGTIYKVQIAKQGSGKLYAKRLHVSQCDGCDRCNRGTRPDGATCHTATFRYDAGAIHTLQADWKMSLEAARAFGKLYGICCACGADLTDETSIAEGIGPICGKRF